MNTYRNNRQYDKNHADQTMRNTQNKAMLNYDHQINNARIMDV